MADSSTSGTVDREGFRLDFTREGAGIPMLVVGEARYYPRVLPEPLRDDFAMVFGDLRPWVKAPDGFDMTTISRDTYSDDIEAVRVAAGLERPIVLGHSIHGTLALEYARRYPENVSGVVAVGGHPVGTAALWEAVGEFFARDADADRLAAHEANQTVHPAPTTFDKPQDFIDGYLSNAALYWYDPTSTPQNCSKGST